MSLFYGSNNILPQAVTAKSVKALHRKIRNLQLVKGMEYKFINFYFDGSEHVGWYYILLDETEIIREKLDGTITK